MVVVVLHLHRVNKGWQLFFFFFFFLQILVLRVNFDEESNGDGLEAQKIFLLVLRATFMKIEEK